MIIVDRKTHKTVYADPITQQQKDRAWAAMVQASGEKLLRDELSRIQGKREVCT